MTKTEKGEETMSRKLRKKILGDSLIWVIIAAFVVIMLFPFVYILSTALKSDTDLATSVGRILPKAAQWENFTSFRNTIFRRIPESVNQKQMEKILKLEL